MNPDCHWGIGGLGVVRIGHTRRMRKTAIAGGVTAALAVAMIATSYSTPAAAAPPQAGNPNGHVRVPLEARAVDTSHPTHVVGNGTAASCTSAAVRRAVRNGGKITFDCGPGRKLIRMKKTANVRNDRRPNVVIDGGGKITLSGVGKRRIIYMNTCDARLGITSSHCQDQATPRLVLQNITLSRGNSTGKRKDGGGGGAVFVRGGRLKVVNSRFFLNRCDHFGPDLGGAAIRVLDQYQDEPVYIVHSTFGGAPGYGGRCSNGGALSSIGVSWVVLNSVIANNHAIGIGANPSRPRTPGGGSGGGIYADGNHFTVSIRGTVMRSNFAREGGGAIFFVSNDRTGRLGINHSVLRHNPSRRFETAGYPGIFFLGRGHPRVRHSTIK
jgi:hypothetical protein